MAAWILLLASLLQSLSVAQPELYVPIGVGTSCEGRSGSLSEFGVNDKQIAYDLSHIYEPMGHVIGESGISGNKSLRMSICGVISNEEACGAGDGTWCFEEVRSNDGSCIAGIASWGDQDTTGTSIEYQAMFDSTDISDESALGIRVTVSDSGQYNITCPNQMSIVNYDIICATDTNWTHMSYQENRTLCNWNVTLRSTWGCFDLIDYSSGNAINGLSGGSILLILTVVMSVTYCILGCAYNSFYHGRVGMDAVPNKDSWTNCARYTKAGCAVTREVVCCAPHQGAYEEL